MILDALAAHAGTQAGLISYNDLHYFQHHRVG